MDAQWWQPLDGDRVACALCPIGCRLRPGQDGPCGTRGNRRGRMATLHYGKVVALGVDPIEKKPLYHFLPGSLVLSVAAPGCNMHCLFCQNWGISQKHDAATRDMSPQHVVDQAVRAGSRSVAFTYSEPLVWYEFVCDTAQLARDAGLRTVIVSNGFLNREPLAALIPYIDAANIDLKSMDDGFYRKVCKARLQPVLDTITDLHAAGVHLEITNLVIPGQNDSDAAIAALADFVGGLSRTIPLHLSAYHPSYRFDAPATPPATLAHAAAVCAQQVDHVYVGNCDLPEWNDTLCPQCGATVIARVGYHTQNRLTADGQCPRCRHLIACVVT